MATYKSKNHMLVPHEWLKALDKMSNEDAGELLKALLLLDATGKETTFEQGTILDILYAQYSSYVLRNKEAYEEECTRRSDAAKEREAKKAQQTTKSTTKHNNVRQSTTVDDKDKEYEKDKEKDKEQDISAVADIITAAPTPDQEFNNAVVSAWNSQECTRNIPNLPALSDRENQMRLCLSEISNSYDRIDPEGYFLDVVKSLDKQEWFLNRAKQRILTNFDWFIKPNNFRKVLEGNYSELYYDGPTHGEGWE